MEKIVPKKLQTIMEFRAVINQACNIQVSKYPFIITNYLVITVKRRAQDFVLFMCKDTQTNWWAPGK
jgi:hypothetical protein